MKLLAGLFAAVIALNIVIYVAHRAPVRVVIVPAAALPYRAPAAAAPSDHERLEAMGRVLKAQQEQIDSIGQPQGPPPLIRDVRGPTPDENAMIDEATAQPLIRDVHN